MIQLSICIPTYNFGRFIGQTLDSIIPNLSEGVEVIILDGGSKDDTALVVSQKQKDCQQIVYHRQSFRGGIDRDISKVISLAHGEYCWLFSADDIMKSGAVAKVLKAVQSNSDIYLCEITLCNFEMQPVRENPVFDGITDSEIFDLGNPLQRDRYFRHARTSEAFFSFLAGPIFRRELWERAKDIPESFYGTCWGLAGRLLSLVPGGLVIHYMGESLLFRRGENDSFAEQGIVNRFGIAVEGYRHIADTLFGSNSSEASQIRRVIRNEWTLPILLPIKLLTALSPQKESLTKLYSIASLHYLNAGMINSIKYLVLRAMPVSMIKIMMLLKKCLGTIRSFKRHIFHGKCWFCS